jgi:phosphoribosylformylglycinamidine cyclo-ligase
MNFHAVRWVKVVLVLQFCSYYMSNLYNARGVSADKEDVHQAIKHISKGLYPQAFCKILPDFVAGDDAYCNLMHADTAGTKTAIAYLYYNETGDASIWKGIVQDALVMNIDDMLCVGVDSDIVISSTVARNKNKIPAEVISAIISGAEEFAAKMKTYDVQLHMAGGETADVGDIVRTIDVGYTAFARMKKSDVVDMANVTAGDVIVSIASYGQATYEDEFNSGIGSNGLTSARHDMLHKIYLEKYPECVDPNLPKDVVFNGAYQVTDIAENGISIGKLLLSPTRTFAPLLKKIFAQHRAEIKGIVHNTGGAASKCLHYINDNLHVIKDNLLPAPLIFELIQKSVNTPWQEMYKVFNMGNRLEIYTNEATAESIVAIAKSFNIDAQICGRVEAGEGKKVKMHTKYGEWEY